MINKHNLLRIFILLMPFDWFDYYLSIKLVYCLLLLLRLKCSILVKRLLGLPNIVTIFLAVERSLPLEISARVPTGASNVLVHSLDCFGFTIPHSRGCLLGWLCDTCCRCSSSS